MVFLGYKLKPDPVRCYLSEDSTSQPIGKSEISPKAKPQVNSTPTSEYVEMCRRQLLTGK